MNTQTIHDQDGLTAFRILVVGEAAVFLSAAFLHTGAFGVPPLYPAAIVEGLCGIASLISAYRVFSGPLKAYRTAVIIQIIILSGVLLGVAAIARDPGIQTPLNLALHGVMLVFIATGFALLALPDTRRAFGKGRTSRSGEG